MTTRHHKLYNTLFRTETCMLLAAQVGILELNNFYCFSRPGLLNLIRGAISSAKFGLHAGNMILNTQSEKSLSKNIIIRTVLPVNLSVHHVQ